MLRRCLVGPRRRARQPAIPRQSKLGVLVAQDVLGVDVRLALVFVDRVILGGGVDPGVVVVGARAVADQRFRDHDPGIDVQEDPAVLFSAGGIGAHAANGGIVAIVARRAQLDAVPRGEAVVHGVQGQGRALRRREPREHRPRLPVGVNLAGRVALRAERLAIRVEILDVPRPIPGLRVDARFHLGMVGRPLLRQRRLALRPRQLDQVQQRPAIQARAEH